MPHSAAGYEDVSQYHTTTMAALVVVLIRK